MTIRQRITNAYRAFVSASPRPRVPAYLTGLTRMYAAAKSSRLTEGFGSSANSSADAELQSSLRSMRSRSREVIRDAGYATRARTIVVTNVIGSGMGMQAQIKTSRGDLNKRINDELEAAWAEWSRAVNCHTGGALHFSDIERFAMAQVFEAGEVFIRKHYRAFGESSIPYALEVIEPERVVDEFQPSPMDSTARVRMGVECDKFHRPIAYWIHTLHPGDTWLSAGDIAMVERVPADQIIHLRIVERWPQTRGVPWLHTALRKLYDMDGYTEAEIVRARAQANVVGGLKTDRPYGEEVKDSNGKVTGRQVTSEAGTYETLYQDEELQFPPPTAPNSSADPFLRFLLREVAAGTGPSYESLSRDYGQSNYSSSRQGILEDRDLWRTFQSWFIRSLRQPVHLDWVQAAVLSRSIMSIPLEQYALDPRKFSAVRFKPRGWSWVDPTSEVAAYKEAEKAGYITKGRIISMTADGSDHEDMMEERKDELATQKEKGLAFDTDPEVYAPQPPAQAPDNGEEIKRISDNQDKEAEKNEYRFGRLISEQRKQVSEIVKAINSRQATFNFNPTTNVSAPSVSVPVDARSTVTIPDREVNIANHVDVQPSAPAQVTVPIENRVDVQPSAPAQVTVPIENRVDVQPAAPAQVTVPIENRVDVQPAAPAQVAIENRVDVQPSAAPQVTVPIENRFALPVQKREKRTMVMLNNDGSVRGKVQEE